MSRELDEQVELELKKLAEGSIATQKAIEMIGTNIEKYVR